MKTKNTLITAAVMFATIGLHAAYQMDIATTFIDGKGNAADTRTTEEGGTVGRGEVSYDYYIGTTEVTASQYATFLNAVASTSDAYGLYNTEMYDHISGCGIQQITNGDGSFSYAATKGDNMPVNFVSVYDAMRFCNWVTSGYTEVGVYMLNGTTNDISLIVRNDVAWQAGGVAIASLDEWYKAAFYDKSTGNYSTYANGSDTVPVAGTEVNVDNSVGDITDVRAYEGITASFYGVLDMNGNVWEWSDTVASESNVYRRGGTFSGGPATLAASFDHDLAAVHEYATLGFRVSSLNPIPEPSTYAAIFGALALAVAAYRRRK